jgi:hypothetical protein
VMASCNDGALVETAGEDAGTGGELSWRLVEMAGGGMSGGGDMYILVRENGKV